MVTIFRLNRIKDVSGVSGVGIVAYGTEYPNGKVTLAWMGNPSSVGVYDSMKQVVEIHCHGDSSQIEVVSIIRD